MMNGTCPFASHWKRAEAETMTTSTLSETDANQVHDGFAPKCPVLDSAEAPGASGPSVNSGGASCPLGFGSSRGKTPSTLSLGRSGLPRMSLAVLAAHLERDEKVRLVSIKGVIFDVSEDVNFKSGGPLARLPGHDASRFIASSVREVSADHESDGLLNLDAGLEGLTYQDHQRLETYYVRMLQARRAVAVLAEEDYVRIFAAPLDASVGEPSGVAHQAGVLQSPSAAVLLHASVERGEAESVRQLLNQLNEGEMREEGANGGASALRLVCAKEEGKVIDALCPRTGMTPLLKAVEGGTYDIVRMLLEAGADVRAKATLYDNDDAIALARRLGSREAISDLLLQYLGGDKV